MVCITTPKFNLLEPSWPVKACNGIALRLQGAEKTGIWGRVPPNLQMREPRILIRLLRMYIPRNWEFGSALSKLRNFGEGLNPPTPPPNFSVRQWGKETGGG
jgi:hypothetical protein